MKTNQNFTVTYILLAVAQMVICNYFKVSPYVYVTILPAMILALPLKIGTIGSMAVAFVTGLGVDFLAEGIIGLNALALVPVALVRLPLLQMVMGDEDSGKENPFGARSASFGRILLAVTIAYAIFTAVYVIADGAGVRPFWFNAARFGASLICDSLLALLVIHVLTPNAR
ncbi:MAG: hypothetical protein IAB75_04860 [Bacteroidetes bacterium]|uniref:Rod shape-determining protein MreD n=1 Tax=Candidatus Cryptobacteroides avicola TaxID=2840757 RepID=A0A940DRG5_9BACT|nr:hypothetical protein [Candidatus Cryptobacteroides avicola]